MTCSVCKKDFVSETGRRPKKFCSNDCKVKFWNAQKKVAENNKPENKKKIEAERNTPHGVGEKHKTSQPVEGVSVQELIEKLEAGLKFYGDTSLGKMARKKDENKIAELKKQLPK